MSDDIACEIPVSYVSHRIREHLAQLLDGSHNPGWHDLGRELGISVAELNLMSDRIRLSHHYSSTLYLFEHYFDRRVPPLSVDELLSAFQRMDARFCYNVLKDLLPSIINCYKSETTGLDATAVRRRRCESLELPSNHPVSMQQRGLHASQSSPGQLMARSCHQSITEYGCQSIIECGCQSLTECGRQSLTECGRHSVTECGRQSIAVCVPRQSIAECNRQSIAECGRQSVTDCSRRSSLVANVSSQPPTVSDIDDQSISDYTDMLSSCSVAADTGSSIGDISDLRSVISAAVEPEETPLAICDGLLRMERNTLSDGGLVTRPTDVKSKSVDVSRENTVRTRISAKCPVHSGFIRDKTKLKLLVLYANESKKHSIELLQFYKWLRNNETGQVGLHEIKKDISPEQVTCIQQKFEEATDIVLIPSKLLLTNMKTVRLDQHKKNCLLDLVKTEHKRQNGRLFVIQLPSVTMKKLPHWLSRGKYYRYPEQYTHILVDMLTRK